MIVRERRGGGRLAGVMILALLLSVLFAGPVAAHATLVQVTPVDGAVIAQAPAEVRLHFSERVGLSAGSIKLLAPDGTRVDVPAATATDDGSTAVQPLPAGLGPGTYTVLWRVLSEDTHSVFGAVTFSVGQPGGGAAGAAQAAAQAGGGRVAEAALDAGRWLLYLGLCLLLGVAAFVVVLWPAGAADRRTRRLIRIGWWTTAGATVLGLLAQGPSVAGVPVTEALDPELLTATALTRFGLVGLARLALLGAALLLLRRPVELRRGRRAVAAAVVAAGLLVTVSLTGHAGAGAWAPLALPADVLHLAAMAAWLGGLAVLLAVVLRPRPDPAPAGSAAEPAAEPAGAVPDGAVPDGAADPPARLMRRWSRYAASMVAVLVVTGAFAAWQQVREPGALLGTGYGILLLVKLGLVLLIVAVAAVARSLVGARAARVDVPAAGPVPIGVGVRGGPADPGQPDPPLASGRRLRRAVLVETAVAVLILAVTSVLVGEPPARDTYFPVVEQVGPAGPGLQATVTVDPARAGLNTVRVRYGDPAGRPVDVVRAGARWTSADGAYVVPTELVRDGPGAYAATGTALPVAGQWRLELTTRTSDINSTTTLFVIRIR